MSKIIGNNAGEDFQKLLEKQKLYNKPEVLPITNRLDVPSEPPTSPQTSAINNSILKKSIEGEMADRMQQLTDQQAGLSKKTIEGLEQLQKDAEKEDAAAALKKIEEEDDSYYYDDNGNKIRNLHNNRKRRKAIEARCSEMDLADMIATGYVQQTVPIRPDPPHKFIVNFRSLSGSEHLLLSNMVAKDVHYSNQVSSLATIHKISMLRLACGLVSINGQTFPDIKGPDGEPDEKLLETKFKKIARMPLDIIMDLDTNYTWFCERVKSLTVVDNIQNF